MTEIGNRCHIPVESGEYTPTEALRACEAGAKFVRIFPAKTGVSEHIAVIGGTLSQIPPVPTAEIDSANPNAYLKAETVSVGVSGYVKLVRRFGPYLAI